MGVPRSSTVLSYISAKASRAFFLPRTLSYTTILPSSLPRRMGFTCSSVPAKRAPPEIRPPLCRYFRSSTTKNCCILAQRLLAKSSSSPRLLPSLASRAVSMTTSPSPREAPRVSNTAMRPEPYFSSSSLHCTPTPQQLPLMPPEMPRYSTSIPACRLSSMARAACPGLTMEVLTDAPLRIAS